MNSLRHPALTGCARAVAAVASACLSAAALGQPSVRCMTATPYAEFGADYRPYTLTFDDAGFLYAGSDNNADAGVVVFRVPPGGGAAVPFSTDLIYDPDGVILDRTGAFSGVPGAILLGCSDLFQMVGRIRAVRPDGTNFTVVGSSSMLDNNDAMAFDSSGRLYINVAGNGTIVRFTAQTPAVFVTLPAGVHGGVIVIDPGDRLWVSCNDGVVRRYSSSATLEASVIVGSANPGLGYARPGGVLEEGAYVVNRTSGDVFHVGLGDFPLPAGAGFPSGTYHMIFDAAGDMFAADWDSGRIWKLHGCRADFNCDHTVNSQDFFDFLAAFFAHLSTADFHRDGVINSQDFFDFLAAFFAGC